MNFKFFLENSNLELHFGTGFDGIRQLEQFLYSFEICFRNRDFSKILLLWKINPHPSLTYQYTFFPIYCLTKMVRRNWHSCNTSKVVPKSVNPDVRFSIFCSKSNINSLRKYEKNINIRILNKFQSVVEIALVDGF